jgi:hypothetical protein
VILEAGKSKGMALASAEVLLAASVIIETERACQRELTFITATPTVTHYSMNGFIYL